MTAILYLSLGGMLEEHIVWTSVYVQVWGSVPSTEKKKITRNHDVVTEL